MSSRTRKKPKAEEDGGGEAMLSIPEEICLEILLRVPVKSTCVCKCVCKSWLQMITSPSFVMMHLNIATNRNNCNLLFEGYRNNWRIKSISCDSLSSVSASESEIVELVSGPFSYSCWGFRFLGSCNGLVCLWVWDDNVQPLIYIYNPATKEYKGIPKSQHSYWKNYFIKMMNAFGYDCKVDDYKLINIVECDGANQLLDVYTLGSNSWESSRQTITYKFPDTRQTGILVHGAFHWFGETRERNPLKLIISMDISSQKFEEVQLSEELLEKNQFSMIIGVLEGCLCLLVVIGVCFEVWMMQDYGVQESWSRRYIFEHESCSSYTGYTWGLVRSLKNGQILLKKGKNLVIYDPKHSTGREPAIFSRLVIHDSIIYVESLVSLNTGTYAGRKNMKKNNMDMIH